MQHLVNCHWVLKAQTCKMGLIIPNTALHTGRNNIERFGIPFGCEKYTIRADDLHYYYNAGNASMGTRLHSSWVNVSKLSTVCLILKKLCL